MTPPGWYLLIHQLPTKPIYLRASIGERLARLGALALKNSVYVLPRHPARLEDLERIVEEAKASGGEAYVASAEHRRGHLDGGARPQVSRGAGRGLRRARGRGPGCRGLHDARPPGAAPEEALRDRGDRFLRRRRPKRSRRRCSRPWRGARRRSGTDARSALKGRVWATRRGVQIDRIASAWLIRRFIDPAARFRFIDPKAERAPGELRFDMVGGDFTHEGDACTFETLARTIRRPDPALRQIAEIVHDIDIKDGKFGRADAPGIQQIDPRHRPRLPRRRGPARARVRALRRSLRVVSPDRPPRAAVSPSRSKNRRSNP